MTTTILLIRHAAHDLLGRVLCGRMPGVRLNDEGKAQAHMLAEALADDGITAIYVSPLERASETASRLAVQCNLALRVEPALQEIDFGDWTGRGFDTLDIDPDWHLWNRLRQFGRPPGGEYALSAQCRIMTFLHQAASRHSGETIALFSHADMIKSAISWALGQPLDVHDRFDVCPASVSRLVMEPWGTKVAGLNQKLPPIQRQAVRASA